MICARLAMAEAQGPCQRSAMLRAELVEFDEQAKYRVVVGGRLPYREDNDGEAAG